MLMKLVKACDRMEEALKRKTTSIVYCFYGGDDNGMAKALIDQGEYNKAEFCLDKAIELNPGDSYNFLLKGLLLQRKNPEEAVLMLERTVQLDPHSSLAYRALGRLHLSRGDTQRATEVFSRAILQATLHSEVEEIMKLKKMAAAAVATPHGV